MSEHRPKKRIRKAELLPASDVLQTVLGNGKSALSDQFLRWKIWRFWPRIVGQTLGGFCEPVGYDRGRLWIWVKSSARMQEIRFFEDTLKEKVNEYVGRNWVVAVRFTVDRRGIPQESEVSEEFKRFLEVKRPEEINE
ncbi:MAG: DUF721 domain-containing protein [Bdellovibrionales bacterium]